MQKNVCTRVELHPMYEVNACELKVIKYNLFCLLFSQQFRNINVSSYPLIISMTMSSFQKETYLLTIALQTLYTQIQIVDFATTNQFQIVFFFILWMMPRNNWQCQYGFPCQLVHVRTLDVWPKTCIKRSTHFLIRATARAKMFKPLLVIL